MRLSLIAVAASALFIWAFASFHRTAFEQCLVNNTYETCRSAMR